MGTVVSKSQRKNKIRQNAMLVGNLQVSAQRNSECRTSHDASLHESRNEEETKPISMVDSYEVDDSLLFYRRTDGPNEGLAPYFKAWLKRVHVKLQTKLHKFLIEKLQANAVMRVL